MSNTTVKAHKQTPSANSKPRKKNLKDESKTSTINTLLRRKRVVALEARALEAEDSGVKVASAANNSDKFYIFEVLLFCVITH